MADVPGPSAQPGEAEGRGHLPARRGAPPRRRHRRTRAFGRRAVRVFAVAAAGAACLGAGATAGPAAFAAESGLPLADAALREPVGLGLCGGAFGALLAGAALSFASRKRLWLTAAAVALTWLVTFVAVCRLVQGPP